MEKICERLTTAMDDLTISSLTLTEVYVHELGSEGKTELEGKVSAAETKVKAFKKRFREKAHSAVQSNNQRVSEQRSTVPASENLDSVKAGLVVDVEYVVDDGKKIDSEIKK